MHDHSAARHDPREGITVDGLIATGADRSRVPAVYTPVLDAAVTAVDGVASRASLYLYGSVATGTAVALDSDVDLFTIDLPAQVAARIGRELSDRFAEVTRAVQVGAAQPADYEGDGWAARGNRVFLRHYCVHLAGPDPRSRLPDHPADAAAARGFNGDIAIHLDRWWAALDGETTPPNLGRRIGRKCLFTVAGLVSVHDDIWTTDRRLAAERWSEVEPDLADNLHTLLRWGDGGGPPPAADDVERVLEGAVPRIVRAFEQMIGLW